MKPGIRWQAAVYRLAIAAVSCCACMACSGCSCNCRSASSDAQLPSLHIYCEADLLREFHTRGAPDAYSSIWANGRQTGLIANVFDAQTGTTQDFVAIDLSGPGYRRTRQRGYKMWVDDDLHVVAWRDGPKTPVTLASGASLPESAGRHFSADIHGRLFLTVQACGTEVYEFRHPDIPVLTVPDLAAENVYAAPGKLVLTTPQGQGRSEYLLYDQVQTRFAKMAEHEIPGTMIQTDLAGEHALSYLKEDSGMDRWYLIELRSGAVTPLRIAPWCRAFFLNP